MKTLQSIQDSFYKVSNRKYGASPDPAARVSLIEGAVERLAQNPRDLTALTHLQLYVVDLAKRTKVTADELVSAADSQCEIWAMQIKAEEGRR